MKELYKEFLFGRNILVSGGKPDHKEAITTIVYLASKYNMVVIKGEELADKEICKYLLDRIGRCPDAFYRNFPACLQFMSKEELLIDQLIHYTMTYGLGNFDEAGHSLLEKEIVREVFNDDLEAPHQIKILSEEDAMKELEVICGNMLLGSRPLNISQKEIIQDYYTEHKDSEIFKKIGSKSTIAELFVFSKGADVFADQLKLFDISKILDVFGVKKYNDLHLTNKQRKLLTNFLDFKFNKSITSSERSDCFEKQKMWCGLLHHIHYKATTPIGAEFVNQIRSGKNHSALSTFEKSINSGFVGAAADFAASRKGTGFVLRNLDYLLSRCKNDQEIQRVAESIQNGDNYDPMILIQTILKYKYDANTSNRAFTFTKNNKMKVHRETDDEVSRRKTILDSELRKKFADIMSDMLDKKLKKRDEKIFIDPAMQSIALPIYNSTSESGLGVLPTGSRMKFTTNILRAFVYWEKVNDIDLSMIGIDKNNQQHEFSWRNMYRSQCPEIYFSGDQTSGYNGGSEFFDINLDLFKQKYPDMKYLICNANVYSASPFKDCYCTAGYMARQNQLAGEVYEPKTVKTSFLINGDTTYEHLFAIDLATSEIVWLNIAMSENNIVAGTDPMQYLEKYFHITQPFNYADFLKKIYTVVDSIDGADIIATSDQLDTEKPVIYPYDVEIIHGLLKGQEVKFA